MSGEIPSAPPTPPIPTPYSLPPELLEDDEFTEKRYQKELQFLMVGAIERADTRHLQELIDKGVNTNAVIVLVQTPLTQALYETEVCYDIIETLLNAKGTDPNLADFTPSGTRPLHMVAELGRVDLAKLFLEGPKKSVCKVDAVDNGEATPFHFAARYGHCDMVKYLLECGADMLKADGSGRTALHRACEFKHKYVAQILLANGFDVNVTDNFGWTPLFHSIFFSDANMAEFLIENGARADLHDIYGKSLLDIACFNNFAPFHEELLPVKVALKTSFNFVQRSKAIPPKELVELLHNFRERFFLEDHASFSCVKLLLNAGADPKECHPDKMVYSTFGVYTKHRVLLIIAGAKLDPQDTGVAESFSSRPAWRAWIKYQISDQISLFRQCRYQIRRSLAQSRNIDKSIDSLPIPESLKENLRLEREFEEFMENSKEKS